MALNLPQIHPDNSFITNALAIYGAINRGREVSEDLKQKGISDQYLPQELQNKNALLQAQTGHINQDTKLMPLSSAINAQNAMTKIGQLKQSQSRFGNMYALTRFLSKLSPAQFSLWTTQNPQAYESLLNFTANKALNNADDSQQSNAPNILTPQFVGGFFQNQGGMPQAQQAQPMRSQTAQFGPPQTSAPMQNALLAQTMQQGVPMGSGQPMGQNMPPQNMGDNVPRATPAYGPAFITHPGDVDDFKRVGQLTTLKDSSDANTRQRVLYGNSVLKTMQMINPVITKFAGPQGKAELAKQAAIAASGGTPSNDYIAYRNAVDTFIPLASEQIGKFYSGSVRDEALRNRMKIIFNKDAWLTNPQIALSNFNAVKDIIEKEVNVFRGGLQSTKAYGPVSSAYQGQSAPTQPALKSDITAENLAHTAKLHGMTVAQLKAILRQRGVIK